MNTNKTAKELNTEHERKELLRVRPKRPEYNCKELESIVNNWIRSSKESR